MFRAPSRDDSNASQRPSGENVDRRSSAGCEVIRAANPPLMGIAHRSPFQAKTMLRRSGLMEGYCGKPARSRGAGSDCGLVRRLDESTWPVSTSWASAELEALAHATAAASRVFRTSSFPEMHPQAGREGGGECTAKSARGGWLGFGGGSAILVGGSPFGMRRREIRIDSPTRRATRRVLKRGRRPSGAMELRWAVPNRGQRGPRMGTGPADELPGPLRWNIPRSSGLHANPRAATV